MTAGPSESLQATLQSAGQSHLLQFWDQLDAAEQQHLVEQLTAIDFELIADLAQQHSAADHWSTLAARAVVPPAITLDDLANPDSYNAALTLGEDTLRAGEVGMILVAGGQGSRLGFEHPKGMFPIGPVSDRTLYQIHFENVLARSRQFGKPIPIYVMTSPPTHAETTEFLQSHNFFGVAPDDVRIFCQGVMPAVDRDGKLLLEERGKVFVSPDGHGGMLAALVNSGCLEHAKSRGVTQLFYGQVDNPLVQVAHPALLGYHLQAGSEMTSQVVRKHSATQKVGNVVEVDGKVMIIEYSDLPEEFAQQTNDDGSLKLWAGSIAVHVFAVDFLERCSGKAETLPFHQANKKVPFVDSSGELVHPDQPNAIKFERFIFDLLPFAKNAIVIEVDPADGFCAVKNAPPATSETPDHVRHAISDLHKRWLRLAGAQVADDVLVEINPLYAVDAETLHEKLPAGTVINETRYFQ